MTVGNQLELFTTEPLVCELWLGEIVRKPEDLRLIAGALLTIVRYKDRLTPVTPTES